MAFKPFGLILSGKVALLPSPSLPPPPLWHSSLTVVCTVVSVGLRGHLNPEGCHRTNSSFKVQSFGLGDKGKGRIVHNHRFRDLLKYFKINLKSIFKKANLLFGSTI